MEAQRKLRFEAVDSHGKKIRLSDYRGRNVILVFYQGDQCLHCMEQMNALNDALPQFKKLGADVIAVSKDSVDTLASYAGSFGITLLSDPDFKTSRSFQSFDDFEEIELHSTFLIDAEGRIHWSQIGGEPYMKLEFLKSEIRRLNGWKKSNKPVGLSRR